MTNILNNEILLFRVSIQLTLLVAFFMCLVFLYKCLSNSKVERLLAKIIEKESTQCKQINGDKEMIHLELAKEKFSFSCKTKAVLLFYIFSNQDAKELIETFLAFYKHFN